MKNTNRSKLASIKLGWLAMMFMLVTAESRGASQRDIHVSVDQVKCELEPHLYGLFYEDINYAGDGGLYAELVQNRSFEYYFLDETGGMREPTARLMHPLYAWEKVERGGGTCRIKVEKALPMNSNNTNYMVLYVDKPGEGVGVANLGFDGIHVDKGEVMMFLFSLSKEEGE